jgi:two-component system sensor histidine kinase QseC
LKLTVLPPSLRGRLLVALLLVLLLFLGSSLCAYAMMLSRQQTGWWDSSLRVVAQQILQSLPDNLSESSSRHNYRLPDGVARAGPVKAPKFHEMNFQVWTQGRIVVRSPGSPATPLRPDFVDGFADVQGDGPARRVYSIGDSTGRLHVQVAHTHEQLNAELARWIRLTVVASAMMFVLLAGALWLVICWSLRPVNAVREAIQRRNALDLSPLPTTRLPLEVAPMVDSFNQLLQRLDTSLQGERRFIADAAHELRTPLAALLTHTELALGAADPQASRAALAHLAQGIQRSARLTEQLLDLARLDTGRPLGSERRVRLYEVIEVVVHDFELTAAQRRQRIVLELEACEVVGDVDMLGILLRNLVDNALRYGDEGGRVRVACESRGKEVMLSVADDGPGVPRAEHERVFDRFYRVAGRGGRGSGVGLSLVARIAELYSARIATGDGLDGRGFSVALHFTAPPPTDAPVAPVRPSVITNVLRADRPLP